MTKTIILTDLIVKNMEINYETQIVRVVFIMIDDQGTAWETRAARFWVTLPAYPSEYDFQLPSSYFPTLIQLQLDADQALTDRFLV